jgi:hypothetical protein
MLPYTEAEPTEENVLQKVNIKLVFGIFIGLVIIGWLWFTLLGPGRSILEQKLISLRQRQPTATQHIVPSPTHKVFTQLQPSETPSPTPTIQPTVRPTNTPAIGLVASPTYISVATVTDTSTPQPTCRDVSTITLADVGQTLCVRGVVIETITNPTNFMVIFSNKRGAFYWVSYDLVWSAAELHTCYQTRGTINQISNSPILIFDMRNLPEVCP